MEKCKKELIETALAARKNAYAPYSRFCVGAALLAEDGRIFSGCNVENAAYSPGNCAERTAFFCAVNEGARAFRAIAIAGGAKDETTPSRFCPPCGVCRQVMAEFCDPSEFRILLVKNKDEYREYRLEELLPLSFGPESL